MYALQDLDEVCKECSGCPSGKKVAEKTESGVQSDECCDDMEVEGKETLPLHNCDASTSGHLTELAIEETSLRHRTSFR